MGGGADSLSSVRSRVGIGLRIVTIALATACEGRALAWTDPSPIAAPEGPSTLVITDSGDVRWVTDSVVIVPMSGACAKSLSWARDGKRVFATWWAPRADSSARLMLAASGDAGSTWKPPVAVDTLDVSDRGCARPAPSVAVAGPDVHVAYSMRSAEGTGVFLAHSMDGGAMFHSPIPASYGDRMVDVAVAAQGSNVIVAYEEPSGTPGTISLALSRTQGHTFEIHTRASRAVDRARSPRVAIAGQRIAVTWLPLDAHEARTATARVAIIEP